MAIHYMEEDRKISGIKRSAIRKWLHEVVRMEGKKAGSISYIFCSDDFLVDINIRFLQRDYYTDVISFDYSENNVISGDIMISIDRVKENALNMGIAFTEELKRIMVHGLLHLVGYEDSSEENRAIMSNKEDLYLALSGNGYE